MAFAAAVGPAEHERIVAASSYYLSPATGLAEVAYIVDPEWQGTGLAGLLHARMFEYARGRGVRGFRADVLVGNARVLRVFERAGHQMRVKTSAGMADHPCLPWPWVKRQSGTTVPDVLVYPGSDGDLRSWD